MANESHMHKKFGEEDVAGVISAARIGDCASLLIRDGKHVANAILVPDEAIALAHHLLSIALTINTKKEK